jgi:hypothetical protein
VKRQSAEVNKATSSAREKQSASVSSMPEQPQGCSPLSPLMRSTASHAHAGMVLRDVSYCSFHSGVRGDLFVGFSPAKPVRPQWSPCDFYLGRPAFPVGGATAFALSTVITNIKELFHETRECSPVLSPPFHPAAGDAGGVQCWRSGKRDNHNRQLWCD